MTAALPKVGYRGMALIASDGILFDLMKNTSNALVASKQSSA